MSDAEYEVESITKARVDAKRGKKIIWKYYVKWKGYNWDESTWEPDKSFTSGSKHFIKAFWENALTRGRDHTNPAVFDRGEEIYASGADVPPENTSDDTKSPTRRSGDVGSDDEPLTTKKRRIHQEPAGARKPKRKRHSEPAIAGNTGPPPARTFGPKSKGTPPKSKKQRRVSFPAPGKIDSERRPSITNMTDTDAVGELDMDLFGEEVKEVEDELMTTGPCDTQEISESHVDPIKVDSSSTVVFEDLKKFSPDLQNAIEVTQMVTEDETPPGDEGRSSPDPLFNSPSRLGNGRSLSPAEPAIPLHRTRAANPLVRLIDAPQMINNPEVPISAKARLISRQSSGSSQDAGGSNGVTRLRSRPGPGRSSEGLSGKNRSSLLTASKGGLTSMKGSFKPVKNVREDTEPIEDNVSPSRIEHTITPWSDEDAAGDTDHEHQEPQQMESASTHDPTPPSGPELLEIAGLQPDADILPDFEDETNIEQPPEPVNVVTVTYGPAEDAPATTMTAKDKAAEKSLSDATEHLFPSLQATNSILSRRPSSWKTSEDNTIFGRMYKLQQPAQGFSNGNETVPTFRLILNVNASVPLVLKDMKNMKGVSLTDISADKSMDCRAGSFYVPEDAVRIASTFSGLGSARVVPDPSADENQKAQFNIFQRRLQSGQIFVAKAGKELLTFFSSQNLEIAQRLAPPPVLVGLANTVLLMRVQITNSNGYANAVMQISPAI